MGLLFNNFIDLWISWLLYKYILVIRWSLIRVFEFLMIIWIKKMLSHNKIKEYDNYMQYWDRIWYEIRNLWQKCYNSLFLSLILHGKSYIYDQIEFIYAHVMSYHIIIVFCGCAGNDDRLRNRGIHSIAGWSFIFESVYPFSLFGIIRVAVLKCDAMKLYT